MEFYGVFKNIENLNIDNIQKLDIYEGIFAEFYEDLSGIYPEELEIYLRNAYATNGKVLELACGNGRITVEMAKNDIEIIGVDYSDDMLAILDKKLKKMNRRVRNNVTFYQGDVFNLDIKEDFSLVILPATTICLFIDDIDKISKVFNYLYHKLPSGGRFVFDYICQSKNFIESHISIHTKEDKETKQFTMWQEFRSEVEGRAIMNFYTERISGETTERFLGHTDKRIVSDELIKEIISRTDFKVIEEIETGNPLVGNVKYVVLEK